MFVTGIGKGVSSSKLKIFTDRIRAMDSTDNAAINLRDTPRKEHRKVN
jgi:hypothetical protein